MTDRPEVLGHIRATLTRAIDADAPRRRRRRLAVRAGVGGALVVVAGVFAVVAARESGDRGVVAGPNTDDDAPESVPEDAMVAMPNVTGLNDSEATARLSDAGLAVRLYFRLDETVPSGTAISTEPPAGSTVAVGSQVMVVFGVSEQVTAPDLIGQTTADAIEALITAGLRTDRVQAVAEPDASRAQVIWQEPPPGADAWQGTTVRLWECPPDGDCRVPPPDVIEGDPLAQDWRPTDLGQPAVWAELTAPPSLGATPQHAVTAIVERLSPATPSESSALVKLRESIHGRLLSADTEQASVWIAERNWWDDSGAGADHRFVIVRGEEGWQLADGETRVLCYRGVVEVPGEGRVGCL